MTSSSETRPDVRAGSRVIHPGGDRTVVRMVTPDLRTGQWTRHTGAGLGDEVTESALGVAADEARRVARAQGWSAGWAEGVRAGNETATREAAVRAEQARQEQARLEAGFRAATQALVDAADALERGLSTLATRTQETALELALAVTEAVLGQALAAQLPQDVLRRALAEVSGGETATVRLSPAVLSALDADGLPAGVTLRADATLDAGDAVVDLHDAVVDLRAESALARVREVLR